MFERYQTMNGSRGSLAEVWIDRDARLVRKLFKPNGITIRGGPPIYDDIKEIERLWQNEVHWSQVLRGDLVLETYEWGPLAEEPGYWLLQEWVGPDLLHYYGKDRNLSSDIRDPCGQIVEMFKWWQTHSVYKMNNAMANLVNDNGKIRAFDFKYAASRSPELRARETHSIDTWLCKIDPRLGTLLREYV